MHLLIDEIGQLGIFTLYRTLSPLGPLPKKGVGSKCALCWHCVIYSNITLRLWPMTMLPHQQILFSYYSVHEITNWWLIKQIKQYHLFDYSSVLLYIPCTELCHVYNSLVWFITDRCPLKKKKLLCAFISVTIILAVLTGMKVEQYQFKKKSYWEVVPLVFEF